MPNVILCFGLPSVEYKCVLLCVLTTLMIKNFVARDEFHTLVSSGYVMLCCLLSGSWHLLWIVVPSSARVKQVKRDN